MNVTYCLLTGSMAAETAGVETEMIMAEGSFGMEWLNDIHFTFIGQVSLPYTVSVSSSHIMCILSVLRRIT